MGPMFENQKRFAAACREVFSKQIYATEFLGDVFVVKLFDAPGMSRLTSFALSESSIAGANGDDIAAQLRAAAERERSRRQKP